MGPGRAAVVLVVAALPAGCATPDYTYARESRFDRPYRGGAADVALERPADPYAPQVTGFDLFAWLGAVALGWTHGLDAPAPSNRPIGPVDSPPPGR